MCVLPPNVDAGQLNVGPDMGDPAIGKPGKRSTLTRRAFIAIIVPLLLPFHAVLLGILYNLPFSQPIIDCSDTIAGVSQAVYVIPGSDGEWWAEDSNTYFLTLQLHNGSWTDEQERWILARI